ncbi:ubiquinol oxidase subunit II [Salinisphaera sp. USBA-960]|nr:ubiquinol oxidase subunit II [Salifodinibacter halophilus]
MPMHWMRLAGLVLFAPLAGCANARQDWLWIFNPNGPLATWSVYYLFVDVVLLLIIIVPATALTLWVIFRYRRGGHGTYDPSFRHSNLIEVFAWGVPLLVVGALSYYAYEGAHAVAPYDPGVLQTNPAAQANKPLQIDVITTDWQWLFIYPEQDVALANKLILPVGRQINMRLTSASVTNDFYILKLVGQIYVMPGMRTKRKFLIDRPGTYRGFSTEFSGPGFSWMDYKVHVVKKAKFQGWVDKAQATGQALSYKRFQQFAEPMVNTAHKTYTFNHVDPDLFETVIKRVKSGKLTHERPMELTEDMGSAKFRKHSTQ